MFSEKFVQTTLGSYPQTLFDGSPPAVRSSDTSMEAAQSVKESSRSMRDNILGLLKVSQAGLTDDEIEAWFRYRHQTASARRRELVLQGLVKDSGKRRKTRSGRSATVWVKT